MTRIQAAILFLAATGPVAAGSCDGNDGDPQDCGECGHRCPMDSECTGGTCVPLPP